MCDVVCSVLPDGINVHSGPIEKRPESWLDYQLPSHFSSPLQSLYPETVHNDMVFEEEDHLYINDENGIKIPASCSVTVLAHEYQECFDGRLAIGMMKRSKKTQVFPRLEYVNNPVLKLDTNFDITKGYLIYKNGKTTSVVLPNAVLDVDSILSLLKLYDISDSDEEPEYYEFDTYMSDNQILEKWEKNGIVKRNMGTEAHRNAQLALEGLPFRWYDPEMEVFYKFLREYMVPQGAKIMSTEREIRSKKHDLAGSIDAIFKMPNGKIVVVDWKLSDKLYMNMTGFRKMKKPINNLDDCDGAAYSLQLGIYQYILEEEYGMEVCERILVSLSPEHPFVTSVPYLKEEVTYIMENQRLLVETRNSLENYKCDITNRTLVEPVTVDDGRTVSEKVAKLHKLNYVKNEELKKEIEKHIKNIRGYYVLDQSNVRNWKKIMPRQGIVPFT